MHDSRSAPPKPDICHFTRGSEPSSLFHINQLIMKCCLIGGWLIDEAANKFLLSPSSRIYRHQSARGSDDQQIRTVANFMFIIMDGGTDRATWIIYWGDLSNDSGLSVHSDQHRTDNMLIILFYSEPRSAAENVQICPCDTTSPNLTCFFSCAQLIQWQLAYYIMQNLVCKWKCRWKGGTRGKHHPILNQQGSSTLQKDL